MSRMLSEDNRRLEGEASPETSHSNPVPLANVDDKGSVAGKADVFERGQEPPIIFVDHAGKRFIFPWLECKTWKGIETLIERAYSRGEPTPAQTEVAEGKYDLSSSSREIILPEVWESVVQPGWTLLLSLWSSPQWYLPPKGYSKGILPSREPPHVTRRYAEDDEIYESVPRSSKSLVPGRHRSRSKTRSRSASSIAATSSSTPSGSGDAESSTTSGLTSSETSSVEDDPMTEVELENSDLVSPPLPRQIITPTDRDGSRLSFLVDTHGPAGLVGANDKPLNQAAYKEMARETTSILESHMAQSENKTLVHLLCLDGPQKARSGDNVSIRWHHLSADQLDFTQFWRESLSIPGLSTRLRRLASKLLDRVEKEKVRTFIDGLFIEPGTVMRCEERNRDDSISAIFACVPLFNINAPTSINGGPGQRLHPSRSLMQSYYPYESVSDREKEQAFRKYSEDSSTKIIHVPLYWMLTLGSEAIVTCGYTRLADIIGKSITIVRDGADVMNSTHRTIRITDLENRVFLYSFEECKTYFELEQKLREIKFSSPSMQTSPFQIVLSGNSDQKITPANWIDIVQSWKSLFLDLTIVNEKQQSVAIDELADVSSHNISSVSGRQSKDVDPAVLSPGIPPFLAWSPFISTDNSLRRTHFHRKKSDSKGDSKDPLQQKSPSKSSEVEVNFNYEQEIENLIFAKDDTLQNLQTQLLQHEKLEHPERPVSAERLQLIRNLARAEKHVTSQTLDPDTIDHDVERPFTSTVFYESLGQRTLENLIDTFPFLKTGSPSAPDPPSENSSIRNTKQPSRASDAFHDLVVNSQRSEVRTLTRELIRTIHQTLELFVASVNMSAMLRKCWEALHNMVTVLVKVQEPRPEAKVSGKGGKSNWTYRLESGQLWVVRNKTNSIGRSAVLPNDDDHEFELSVKKCKACRKGSLYETLESAIEHLREIHLPSEGKLDADGDTDSPSKSDRDLGRWVRNVEQMWEEERGFAGLAILSQILKGFRNLYTESEQLLSGVAIGKGQMSPKYGLPVSLIESLRRLVVLILATERAIHVVDERFQNWQYEQRRELAEYLTTGLAVLQRFTKSVELSLSEARKDLCVMVRSDAENNLLLRLALGPQFIISWIMRRLLIQPVDNNKGTADLYREYLSTLQFQVNHRPSKRLLRDINLLQEELIALDKVNDWQTKVIENYIAVLDDATYQNEIGSRRALFPHERNLLSSCLDLLSDNHEDYLELLERCRPLSETTKQSIEINEEDHGKAILVFTLVTIIFLPLSFVTSYLGMNTADIRNMNNKQTIFWEIAIPLTAVTVGSILLVAYNGDDLRDSITSAARRLTGKPTSKTTRGLSVAQRKRVSTTTDSFSRLDNKSVLDETEFSLPTQRTRRNLAAMEMRTRRRIAGFEDNDLDGVIAKKSSPSQYDRREPPRAYGFPDNDNRPAYMRVAKRYVSADSLAFFEFPWEYDAQDPNYIIIFRELSSYQTDELFEHTQRQRGQRREERSYRVTKDKPEYSWVDKRRRSSPGKWKARMGS